MHEGRHMEGRNSLDRSGDREPLVLSHNSSSLPRHPPGPGSASKNPTYFASQIQPDDHSRSAVNGAPAGGPLPGPGLEHGNHSNQSWAHRDTVETSDPDTEITLTKTRFGPVNGGYHQTAQLRKGSSMGTLVNSMSSFNSYSCSTSTTSSINSMSRPRRKKLAVEGDWRVDVALKERYGAPPRGLILLPVMKWIVTILLFAAILATLVSAKVSLLVLARLLRNATEINASGNERNSSWTQYTAIFIMMFLVMSVPPAFNMLRAVHFGVLSKAVPWPRPKSILLIILNAAIEAVGLCMMCYWVLGHYQAAVSLLLLAATIVLPSVDNFHLAFTLNRHKFVSKVPVVLSFLGILFCMAGIGFTIHLMVATSTIVADVWRVVVAVVGLSVAWFPSFLSHLSASGDVVSPKDKQREEPTDSTQLTDSESSTERPARGSVSPEVVNQQVASPAVWKAAFLLHAFKLVFIFVVTVFMYCFDSGASVSQIFSDHLDGFLDAWNLADVAGTEAALKAFGVTLATACAAYVLSFAACHIHVTRAALAPPLLLNIPAVLVLLLVHDLCDIVGNVCDSSNDYVASFVLGAICFTLAHLGFTWRLFHSGFVFLLQETKVFLMPGYSGAAQDTTILLNTRPLWGGLSGDANSSSSGKTKIYICTTMYREEEDEMRQLLESINLINKAQAEGERCFESHIVFDGGVKQRELSEFALVLVSLLKSTLGIRPEDCTKVVTPYGLKLTWALPGPAGKRMTFNIHLKDNLLVKNKKRWSQVMYMSYVLDFLEDDSTENDHDSFILTTDADVVFTPESVEALLDLMTRDPSIGAVCARTHPMGDGPLVWYQVFEYAIGHWFQKAAEHVLGSVLCAPGCFSVFRCRALADVLPKYSKRVETPFDFLTKDMGEDRWLCTLMVQSGWRIEYCAAAENSTNCPSHFEEFYKQRRRWIASTLANLMLIVKEWRYVRMLNYGVPVIFLMYQGLLLFSTLIGPSTIILVVAGGLWYAWDVDAITSVILQVLVCVAFAILCLYTTQQLQLTVAKVYTFLYAIIMTAVVVGTAVQIVTDIDAGTTQSAAPQPSNGSQVSTTTTLAPNEHISVDIPVSVATLYFGGLVTIFLLAALLHPREAHCLLHGIWYLLCLPSGYLVLTIYSICNITDSSWGTREQSAVVSAPKGVPWKRRIRTALEEIFFCFDKKESKLATHDIEVQTYAIPTKLPPTVTEEPPSPTSRDRQPDIFAFSSYDVEAADDMDLEVSPGLVPIPVEDWLPPELQGLYVELFRRHGYDSTLFIAGMTESELKRIGVTSRGHLHYLQAQIALIPAFEIEYKVPVNANDWLAEIGLTVYRDNFRRNQIRWPKDMEILKSISRTEIERELGITKDGHVKRLLYAITKLRDPTDRQQKAMKMRQKIDECTVNFLKESNVAEHDFWEELRTICLQPDLKAFGLEGEVKLKLSELRNNWLVILGVSNILWLILISTLASKSELTVLGANPLGVVFLFVFGLLFIVQFLCMLIHRLNTMSHYIARAQYCCGRPLRTSWSFRGRSRGQDLDQDTCDRDAIAQTKLGERQARLRLSKGRYRRRPALASTPETDESSPLVPKEDET